MLKVCLSNEFTIWNVHDLGESGAMVLSSGEFGDTDHQPRL